MRGDSKGSAGSSTVEYAILLPMILTCILASIVVFLILYQKSIIQSIAEDLADSLARQWNYVSVTHQEIKSGVYQKTTFEEREIYWNLKLWKNNNKEEYAQEYCQDTLDNLGLLKFYSSDEDFAKPQVDVEYVVGIPCTITVNITTSYILPGSNIMALLGWSDYLTIEAQAQCHIYDAKDMINTTDYVFQIVRGSKLYGVLKDRIKNIKDSIDRFTN